MVARNYLPAARVLTESLRAVHPEVQMSVLVVDGTASEQTAVAGARILLPEQLGVDSGVLAAMRAMYSVTEFSTALKPWLLQHLVEAGGQPAVYLDPDIEVYAPIYDCWEAAGESGLALTPHTLEPMPRDGLYPSEEDILLAGTFNLGFVAVGPAGLPFLRWWAERLRTDCVVELGRGLFVDQRWVDLAVHYFTHRILRDPTLNVAYWNIESREIGRCGSTFTVGGQPLRFFHFSGFDPGQGPIHVRYAHRRARLLDAPPAVLELYAGYARRVQEAGLDEWREVEYRFSRSVGGIALTPPLRRAWRTCFLEAGSAPPDPFDHAQAGQFAEWARPLIGRTTGPLAAVPMPLRRLSRRLRRAMRVLVHG